MSLLPLWILQTSLADLLHCLEKRKTKRMIVEICVNPFSSSAKKKKQKTNRLQENCAHILPSDKENWTEFKLAFFQNSYAEKKHNVDE